MSVILVPIVSITLHPHVTTPTAIPTDPSRTNQSGTSTSSGKVPFKYAPLDRISYTAAIGPIAFDLSLAP